MFDIAEAKGFYRGLGEMAHEGKEVPMLVLQAGFWKGDNVLNQLVRLFW